MEKLGHEVRKSDAQTWSNDGKVVIGKPATPGYGLELAGAQGSERFQVRAGASQLKVAKQANTLTDRADYRWRGENSRSLD